MTVPHRSKLLERLPATATQGQALRDIHQKLAAAKELFDHHGDGGRWGVYRAVIDVVDYFSSLGIPMATLDPLLAIAGAIEDADKGTASTIFKPIRKPRGGKPPRSEGERVFDGYLVAITECCVKHCQA